MVISVKWFFLTDFGLSYNRVLKGAPNADFFPSYEYFQVSCGSKWSSTKFESDDVIIGLTGVKLVEISSPNFGKRGNTLIDF